MDNSKYSKLGKNFMIIVIGSFASRALSFLFIPLYTHVLTTSEFGIVDTISVTVSLLYPVLTVSISEATLRFTLDRNEDKKQCFSFAFYVWLFSIVIFMICSPLFLMIQLLSDYFLMFFLMFCFSSLYNILSQYIRGLEKIVEFSISGIIGVIVTIVLNVLLLVVCDIGIYGYLISSIAAQGISSIYLFFSVKAHNDLIFISKIDKRTAKDMLKYSWPLIFSAVSWWVMVSSDKYMLIMFDDVSSNGIYSVAQKIPSIVMAVTSMFMTAWQISAVDELGTENTRLFYSKVYHKFFQTQVIIGTTIISFSKLISKILFANEFYNAWKYIPILITANIIYSNISFLGVIYTTYKKTKQSINTLIIGVFVNIILNLIFIPFLGIMGACISTCISYSIIYLIRSADIKKIIKLDRKLIYECFMFTLLIVQALIVIHFNGTLNVFCFGIAVLIILLNKSVIVSMFEFCRKKYGGKKRL